MTRNRIAVAAGLWILAAVLFFPVSCASGCAGGRGRCGVQWCESSIGIRVDGALHSVAPLLFLAGFALIGLGVIALIVRKRTTSQG
jgi:hypothetical protein